MKSALALTAGLGGAMLSSAATEIALYQSSRSRPFREVKSFVPFSPHAYAEGTDLVDLDAAKPSHQFLGLGVSFAETSCKILMDLPKEKREKVLRMLWTKEGANLSVGRLHVGCSDYSIQMTSYDDVTDDFELKHFSIDRDRKYVLPVVKESVALNPNLYLFSSVWTAPGWMKINGELCGGWINPKRLPVFCDYYVKYLSAYRDEGLTVRALTLQNEPYSDQDAQSADCKWGPADEMEAAGRLMPPRLKAAGLETKIWLFDSEPNDWRRILWELRDRDVAANAGGIAWHSYGSDPEHMRKVRAKHPNLPMYHTEMGPLADRDARPLVWWGQLVTRYLNAGCSTFTGWCPVLDEDGLPNTSRGFCCGGLIEVHSETREIRTSGQYDLFRHIGPFVERGADILESPAGRTVTAFRNPDGSHVIVAANASDNKERKLQLQVKFRGEYNSFQLPSGTVSTIVLR